MFLIVFESSKSHTRYLLSTKSMPGGNIVINMICRGTGRIRNIDPRHYGFTIRFYKSGSEATPQQFPFDKTDYRVLCYGISAAISSLKVTKLYILIHNIQQEPLLSKHCGTYLYNNMILARCHMCCKHNY